MSMFVALQSSLLGIPKGAGASTDFGVYSARYSSLVHLRVEPGNWVRISGEGRGCEADEVELVCQDPKLKLRAMTKFEVEIRPWSRKTT